MGDMIDRDAVLNLLRQGRYAEWLQADIAALPAVTVRVPDVDTLAKIIRTVDGQNSLGAGALAEAILAALEPQPAPDADARLRAAVAQLGAQPDAIREAARVLLSDLERRTAHHDTSGEKGIAAKYFVTAIAIRDFLALITEKPHDR